jgi:hypothetical protein
VDQDETGFYRIAIAKILRLDGVLEADPSLSQRPAQDVEKAASLAIIPPPKKKPRH